MANGVFQRQIPCPLLLGLLLILAASGNAYELSELDGDEIAGNAPVLLGWEKRFVPLAWTIIAGNNPPTLSFGEYREVVRASFSTWEEVESSFLRFRAANDLGAKDGVMSLLDITSPHSYSPFRNLSHNRRGPPYDDGMHNVIVFLEENWQEGFLFSSSALGVTCFAYELSDRHIVGADIFINGSNPDLVWGLVEKDESPAHHYDLQNTLTHEIGHFLGLAHPYKEGREDSTMYYSATAGETSKRTLSIDDINGVTFLYPKAGYPLIPPDSNNHGLRNLDNSAFAAGGCSIVPRPENRLGSPWNNPTLFFHPILISLLYCAYSKLKSQRRGLSPE